MEDKTEENKPEPESSKTQAKKRKSKKVTSNNHILRRRTPLRSVKSKKDVYVNNKTNFKAFLKICEKILDSDAKEVIIHGLGGAINKACNLALRLKEIHHDTLELDIKTSSVDVTDDLEPINDDADYEENTRINSAIHIRVFRTAEIGPIRFEE